MKQVERMRLALRVLVRYVSVRFYLAQRSLPEVVEIYAAKPVAPSSHLDSRRLSRAVDRVLVLPWKPLRCLPRAVVLYSLMIEEGLDARLAVGLPEMATTSRAHAWVELDGRDVGPPPGRDGHASLVVYPLSEHSVPGS